MDRILRYIKKCEYLWVFLYFSLLTVILTRSFVSLIADHVPGAVGDDAYFVWLIGWVQKALFQWQVNPIKSPLINYPYGFNIFTTEASPLQIAFALPFSLIKGPVFGYNVSMLATFVLSGIAMYIWVKRSTNSWKAAIIAGTAYAFLPYHITHYLSGHLNMAATQWFPLYFMAFYDVLSARNVKWKAAVGMGIFIGLIALTSMYYLYMVLFLSALIWLIYVLFYERQVFFQRYFWKNLGIVVLICFPFLLFGLGPYVYLHVRADMQSFDFGYVSQFSASITDFLLHPTIHFLFGKWVWENFPRDLWNEATLYLGFVVCILAIYAFIRKWRGDENKILMKLLFFGGLFALILAMGTNVTWMEQPVLIDTPSFLSSYITSDKTPIYLPGYFLYLFFPFYGRMRAWMRFAVFVSVFLCFAAGIGSYLILKKTHQKWRVGIFLIILMLIIVDFLPRPLGSSLLKPRPVDYWLAEQAEEGGLIQLPFDLSYESVHFYYTLTHNKPIIGLLKVIPPHRYFEMKPIMDQFPDMKSVALLKENEIRYIILDKNYFPDLIKLRNNCEELGLEFGTDLAGQMVFLLSDY
ncbi:MAG TPA: hypothetical protein G4N92_07200 [Anaerolineae bacterium]|nr:hypothetical protein [Anaerolineae bacterium]